MKVVFIIILFVLILLALSSGISKVLLMPQEVEFFGKYGFSNPPLLDDRSKRTTALPCL